MVLMLMICTSDGNEDSGGDEAVLSVPGVEVEGVAVIEIASTDSATASSCGEGSKKMFVPTEINSRVIGGADDLIVADGLSGLLAVAEASPFFDRLTEVEGRGGEGYRGRAASQSSLNSGSSSPVDTSAGSRVSSSARCMDSERSGSGRLVGGDKSRIYKHISKQISNMRRRCFCARGDGRHSHQYTSANETSC